ncbi:MAG: hypothetical protein ACT4PT_13465 [Methanobacteriota archaeon]
MASGMATSRETLIKQVWPDKLLYGSIMLFVTSLIGALYGLILMTIGIELSPTIPTIFRDFPAAATFLLSTGAAVLAYMSLAQRKTRWGLVGGVAGVLSLGLLGLTSILSLIAIGFLVQSRLEGEEEELLTQHLTAEMWPDKSLAASMLLLITGVFGIAWGAAIAAGELEFNVLDPYVFGYASIAIGLYCFFAAYLLYHQKGRTAGYLAGIGGVLTFALYIVGPLLSIAAIVLTWKASQENEFGP